MIVKDFKLVNPCRVYRGIANRNKLTEFINNGMQPIIDEDGAVMTFYLNRNAGIRYRKDNSRPRNIVSALR